MPPKPRLNSQSKKALRHSSSIQIQNDFKRVVRNITHQRWLRRNNGYAERTIERIGLHYRRHRINSADMSEYIAASAPLHCMDGWSFLARAIDSTCRGDSNAARHFAYYAELRAVMSFLANQGVGIFNKPHFAVNKIGTCEPLTGINTHPATWLSLRYWADSRWSSSVLQICITPGGHALKTWLTEFVAGAVVSSLVAASWLEQWGIDLKRLSEDQNTRNQSSYRPSELEGVNYPSLEESVELIKEIWSLCEPTSDLFDSLDRHLLRLALEKTFYAKYNQPPRDIPDVYRSDIERMIDAINPSGLSRDEWVGFLVSELDPQEPKMLEYARSSSNLTSPLQHLEVISRAVLLLRLASGAAANLLNGAGLTRQDLSFWFDHIAIARGFWEPGETRQSMTDLYEDVRNSVLDTTVWLEAARGTNPSFARWRREQTTQISQLGECERIGMWGFGL